jgi:hypothetical protein
MSFCLAIDFSSSLIAGNQPVFMSDDRPSSGSPQDLFIISIRSTKTDTCYNAHAFLFFSHKRVGKIHGRYESFLDCPGRNPAHKIGLGAGLIIGTGCSTAAEGLLADNGACRFVVDIEITGGIFKSCQGEA